ncbi:MAG TPA: Kazal-type serine protease inhibitor, partial [bacterium]|nr:Kazal-type serine protease inhibitor [bacterium]
MKRLLIAVVFLIVVFAVSCSNSKKSSNDEMIVPDEDSSVDDSTDEDAVADDTENDENLNNDGDENDDFTNDDIQSDDFILDDDIIEPNDNDGGTCLLNTDCGDGSSFCKKAAGMCKFEGMCDTKPLGCDDNYSPVCGCDNETYSNECGANSAGNSAFYATACMSQLKKATIDFNYSKNLLDEDMEGKISMDLDTIVTELLILSTPDVHKSGSIANITVQFKGANGIYVEVKLAFQTDPFTTPPQDFTLKKSGGNMAKVITDSGSTVGFLTGDVTVTEYEV